MPPRIKPNYPARFSGYLTSEQSLWLRVCRVNHGTQGTYLVRALIDMARDDGGIFAEAVKRAKSAQEAG